VPGARDFSGKRGERYHVFTLETPAGHPGRIAPRPQAGHLWVGGTNGKFHLGNRGFIVAVVDDDQNVLESLEDLLKSAGYDARLFAAAKALLDSGSLNEIDCLISDIDMPVVDGIELARVARASRPTLPIFLITGHEHEFDRVPAAANFYRLFKSPAMGNALLTALSKALPASG
jgi:CheY-like chemotaxis protein